jgi:hypothetical protein
MVMRLLFLTVVATGLSASNSTAANPAPTRNMPIVNPNEGSPTSCPPTSRYEAARRGARLGAHKLNELPVADLYIAVDRRIGGCNAPIIARYNIGAEPEVRSGKR